MAATPPRSSSVPTGPMASPRRAFLRVGAGLATVGAVAVGGYLLHLHSLGERQPGQHFRSTSISVSTIAKL